MRSVTYLVMAVALIGVVAWSGCSSDKVGSPTDMAMQSNLGAGSGTPGDGTTATAPLGGPPGYEPAYYNGTTVTINAIELAQHAPPQAQADFYEVVYPIGWEQMGIPPPQCNPCDHEGNGIDFTDYHDHVLDSIPSNPGHGEYRALWHVNVVVPAYNNDPAHDAMVNAAYLGKLPLESEQAIDNFLTTRLPDNSPVAVEVDTHFYFLCAVVNGNAVH